MPIDPLPSPSGLVVSIAYPHELPGGRLVLADRIRRVEEPEDCFLVRGDSGKSTMQMIGRQSITVGDEGIWQVADRGLGRSLWHGAPVVSAVDEKMIGMLIVDKAGAKIVPIPVQ